MAKRQKPEPDDVDDTPPSKINGRGWIEKTGLDRPTLDVQPGRPARVTQNVLGDGWVEVGIAVKQTASFCGAELTAALRLPLQPGEKPKDAFKRVQAHVDAHVSDNIPELEAVVRGLVEKRRTLEEDTL